MLICYIHNASATIDYKQTGAKIDPSGDRRVLVLDKCAYVCYNMLNMTAFQPDPEKLTAFAELGGDRPPMTDERRKALGEIGLAVESPLEVARERDRRHFAHKLGIQEEIEPRSEEDAAALKQLRQDLQAKRLHGMANDPLKVKEPTPEEKAALIRADADESWNKIEDEIATRIKEGRLF